MNNRFGGAFRIFALTSIILWGASCNNEKGAQSAAAPTTAASGRIAYVNEDTLRANYEYMKTQTAQLEQQAQAAEAEFQKAAQQFQSEAAAFQQKAKSGGFTSEAEGRAAEQRIMQMQQSVENRRAQMSESLQKKQMEMGERIQKTIDAFLSEYNKDNKYDYIISYSKAGPVLYANKAFDITQDVLKGLNNFKPVVADSSSSK
jgi:outer membrane protein